MSHIEIRIKSQSDLSAVHTVLSTLSPIRQQRVQLDAQVSLTGDFDMMKFLLLALEDDVDVDSVSEDLEDV